MELGHQVSIKNDSDVEFMSLVLNVENALDHGVKGSNLQVFNHQKIAPGKNLPASGTQFVACSDSAAPLAFDLCFASGMFTATLCFKEVGGRLAVENMQPEHIKAEINNELWPFWVRVTLMGKPTNEFPWK